MSQPLSRILKKDPSAVLPFALDWTRWLEKENDIIAGTPSVVITPSGTLILDPLKAITVSINPEIVDATVAGLVTFWLKNGTAGQTYVVTTRITTTGGRVDDRSVTIEVVER